MAVLSHARSLDESVITADDSVMYVYAEPPKLNPIRRVDIALRSSRLSDIFSQKYPHIINGTDLGPIIKWDQTRNFFSEWFCNKNLPLILSILLKLKEDKLVEILTSQEEPEITRNSTLDGLFNGKLILSNSQLTEILKSIAAELAQELSLEYEHAYNVCFCLILTPEQRKKHLRTVDFAHDDIDYKKNVIGSARIKIITRLLQRVEA